MIIRNGTVYDGTGAEPRQADVAIRGDRIAGVGDFKSAKANTVIDANGLAVAPGFINMLSWSTESLIRGWPFAKRNPAGRHDRDHGRRRIDGAGERSRARAQCCASRTTSNTRSSGTRWRNICVISKRAACRATSASFIGATTIREYVIGFEDKQPTPEQLDEMRELVRKEMEAGALGIGTSLIYPPAFYAKTEELIELCKVAAKYQGKYISHMRSEGNQLFEALDELMRISARSEHSGGGLSHQSGRQNELAESWTNCWRGSKRAQKEGLKITRRHVHLHRGRHRARRLSAAVDGRRRLSGVVQTAARPGDARENCEAK